MKEPRGERRGIGDSRTLKQEMLYSVRGIARSDDICVWSWPGKLEANFRTRIPHLPCHRRPFLFFPALLQPRSSSSLRFPIAFPVATNRNLFKQAVRLTPSPSSIPREAAVSGLEFTGNNIVARRWPRSGCTCHDKISRRRDASVQLLNCQSQFEVCGIRCDFSTLCTPSLSLLRVRVFSAFFPRRALSSHLRFYIPLFFFNFFPLIYIFYLRLIFLDVSASIKSRFPFRFLIYVSCFRVFLCLRYDF